jgi:hypothetical protein
VPAGFCSVETRVAPDPLTRTTATPLFGSSGQKRFFEPLAQSWKPQWPM